MDVDTASQQGQHGRTAQTSQTELGAQPVPRELSLGAKLAVLIGALLWVVAGGLFYVPATIQATDGGNLDCGSAASPTSGVQAFACGPAAAQKRVQAVTVLIGGLVIAMGGAAVFGFAKDVSGRKAPTE
ncbi:MAG: hypothetical protein ACOYD0_12880 [Candidatus Nanopelagicales bacterium]